MDYAQRAVREIFYRKPIEVYQNLRQRVTEVAPDVAIAAVAIPLGQIGQALHGVDYYHWPVFLRHNLGNIADPFQVAASISIPIIIWSGRSRPVAIAATVATLGVMWEHSQSFEPGRTFDYVDSGIVVTCAIGYVAIRKALSRKINQISYRPK